MKNNNIDVVGYEEREAESILQKKGITIIEKKTVIPPNSEKYIISGFYPRIIRQFISDDTCEITIGYFFK